MTPSNLLLLLACGRSGAPVREVTLGAYTSAREVYGEALLPAFAAQWHDETGETVRWRVSYQGSGTLARAVIEGFEADVVALALEADVDRIADAGLARRDWRATPTDGIVAASVVVLAVRPGNPEGIAGWADLARPGVDVILPNVRTSGGARWTVAALYGAALRGRIDGVEGGDPAAAERLLARVLANVKVMDKGARESMVTFENGVGDVAVTYENEVRIARAHGQPVELVVPRSTLLVEAPAAVVDRYAARHGNEGVAEAFVTFLATPRAQELFAFHGFRPVATGIPPGFATFEDLFTVRDLGGWPALDAEVFGPGAAYDQAASAAAGRP